MALRRLTIGAAVAAVVLAGGTAALGNSGSGRDRFQPPPDSLRALAAPIGLRIGTAVTPFELDTPGVRGRSPATSSPPSRRATR